MVRKKLETQAAAQIKCTVDGSEELFEVGSSLADVIGRCSPYGDEVTIVRVNGVAHRSIDEPALTELHDGDVIDIYPLIIGG